MKGTLWYTGFSDKQIEQIKAKFESLHGSKIDFEVILDPNVLGGFAAHIDGKAYDASLKTRLDVMRRHLLRAEGNV